jgi:Uma2 family endonuclease
MSIKEPVTTPKKKYHYPESDGQPMADNTRQFQWIVTIQGGLDSLYRNDPNIFVAGDLLWYPIEGDFKTRAAPDAMVVFGRPKGHRGAYAQAEENNIPPQVVFEVLSPGNTTPKMQQKFEFYERFGVEEYYIYDPDRGTLKGWVRQDDKLQPIANMQGWVSPRMGVRFGLSGMDLELYTPGGELFISYVEMYKQAQLAKQTAEQERQIAEQARQQLGQERQAAERERAAKEAAWAKLRELGINPEEL